MNVKSIYRRALIGLVIPAMMALYYNQAANWHYHILPNGLVVEHAHPFKKNHFPGTPFQQHHHTDLELSLLSLLYDISALTLLVLVASSLFMQFGDSLSGSYFFLFIPQTVTSSRLLRAPPGSPAMLSH